MDRPWDPEACIGFGSGLNMDLTSAIMDLVQVRRNLWLVCLGNRSCAQAFKFCRALWVRLPEGGSILASVFVVKVGAWEGFSSASTLASAHFVEVWRRYCKHFFVEARGCREAWLPLRFLRLMVLLKIFFGRGGGVGRFDFGFGFGFGSFCWDLMALRQIFGNHFFWRGGGEVRLRVRLVCKWERLVKSANIFLYLWHRNYFCLRGLCHRSLRVPQVPSKSVLSEYFITMSSRMSRKWCHVRTLKKQEMSNKSILQEYQAKVFHRSVK